MPNRPNILLMIADDHRHDAIGAFGDPTVQTPNLDQLAAAGTAFRANYIMGGLSGAVCVPTRATLHTGAHTLAAVQSRTVDDTRNLMTLDPGLPTLGETLRAAGYHTFGTGKWHNDRASYHRAFADARRVFFGGMCDHDKVPLHDYDPTGTYADEQGYMGDGFSSELFADAAIDFIQNYDRDDPFFCYLAFTAPHDPRTPPGEYAAMYDPTTIPLPANFQPEHPFDNGELINRDEELAPFPRTAADTRQQIADYYGMISHMDAQIGRVIESLRASGQLENTVIVYLADHGLAVGQHGLFGKQNLYDHSIRVPLIMCGPGLPTGKSVNELTYSYDCYPTLCALAGIEPPPHVEGMNLLPLCQGAPGRPYLCTIYKEIMASIRAGEWKLIRYRHSPARNVGADRLQLFHIASDPAEVADLSGSPALQLRVQRLQHQLETWLTTTVRLA